MGKNVAADLLLFTLDEIDISEHAFFLVASSKFG
jgi:hypothetical protein